MYLYVEYHGDGGQACIAGRSRVNNIEQAAKVLHYTEKVLAGGGHKCKNSYGVFESDELLPTGNDAGWGNKAIVGWVATDGIWGTRWNKELTEKAEKLAGL